MKSPFTITRLVYHEAYKKSCTCDINRESSERIFLPALTPMKMYYYVSFYSDDCVDNGGCNQDEICREDGACGKFKTLYGPRREKTCLRSIQPRVYSARLRLTTLSRRQSKTLSTIDERGSKLDRNSVFDCHLSPHWRQMTIEMHCFYRFLIYVP